MSDQISKYQAFEPVSLSDRKWPGKTITKAPIWCSVDLRDGNQALVNPMDNHRKLRMFKVLVDMGFKEIEVGFPSASKTDYEFVRGLIERKLIPEDVTIQVLTQARDHLIESTFESIKGARRAIVHLYNSTSTLQRKVVFDLGKSGIREIAVAGANKVMELASKMNDTELVFQYSPESFTGTELEYAVEVCNEVADIFGASAEHKAIINLPATVEMATPNIYADQIEWMHRNLKQRDAIILSVHPHNDRGTGVAAAELGLMAGADRIEGTLFGNGERTGNVCVITLACNMLSQGVDSKLDVSQMQHLRETAEYCNQLPVHPRHPYAGDLVFTAFSGSHQDAIKKGMEALRRSNSGRWEVPYLPIDPQDLGRTYEAIIRVNSQSGKAGIAYIIKQDFELDLPRGLQIEFQRTVQEYTESSKKEVSSEEIWNLFEQEYLNQTQPYEFLEHTSVPDSHASEMRKMVAKIRYQGEVIAIEGRGNGPLAAFVNAIGNDFKIKMRINDYNEHAVGNGVDAVAVAYVEAELLGGRPTFGVGRHSNIVTATLRATVSALNRLSAGLPIGT